MRITSSKTARLYIARQKLFEFFRFDSKFASLILSVIYLARVYLAKLLMNQGKALLCAGCLFRHTQLPFFRHLSTQILKRHISLNGKFNTGQQFIETLRPAYATDQLHALRTSIQSGKAYMFDGRLLILSPPHKDSKGVILVKFTEYFKFFATIFNLDLLCQDYVIVFEPSFSGYFDNEILFLLSYDFPFIIQSPEPVDHEFIRSLHSNLFPVDIGANWWVNHSIFHPIEGMKKDFDLIIVSIWADFKRHFHLFEAMAKSKARLRVALVGKPWPRSLDEIKTLAKTYGVDNQITFYEGISQTEINLLFNRSKAFLLLSKKEGFNKSIIEALFADLPVYLLKGFNYGYHYPYINAQTGAFLENHELPTFLYSLSKSHIDETFTPNKWVTGNMTFEVATERLCKALQRIEGIYSIRINKTLSHKINTPNLDYSDKNVWTRFQTDYCSLKKYLVLP